MIARFRSWSRGPFAARFKRDTGGATAVEFAMLAAPFIALMMGILELAFFFIASVALDNAMMAATRRIRTGELISPSDPAQVQTSRSAFRSDVCSHMAWMEADCNANLTVDVRKVTQFSSIALTNPVQNGVFNPGALTFDTGTAGDIVLVRAYYKWKLISPIINQGLERIPGYTLLTSVTTFKNEPYLTP